MSAVATALEQALAHHRAHRLEPARLAYQRVRQGSPRLFEGYYLGGVVALQLGRDLEALPLLKQAAALQPRHALSYHCLGGTLLRLGRHDEAALAIEKALGLDPKLAEAWSNLGAVCSQKGDLEKAQGAYQKATELDPGSADAWTGLGAVSLQQGRPEPALAAYEKALALQPKHARAGLGRAQALFQLCDVEATLRAFNAHLELHPGDLSAHSQRLLVLHYTSDRSPASLAAEHHAFGQRVSRLPAFPHFAAAPKAADGRVRLGFISPDLRRHSVAYFLEPLLQCLDRRQFAVHLYHDHGQSDDVTERLRNLAGAFRSVVGLADERVAQLIHQDGIDILVDLAGHTGSNRMTLFARRVAPLQVTYLGYPNTTGLCTMDLRIVDGWSDPETNEAQLGSEKVVRLPRCAWSYLPPKDAPEPSWDGPANAAPVLGSFNHANKLSDATLSLWARVLRTCPEARLVIKSSGLRPSALAPRLQAAGLPLERVTLLGPLPTLNAHLEAYRSIDVALDTFPYHGTTTTCEALYMGVPVVSLKGDRHSSRVGASLLQAVNRPDLIAKDEATYVDCVCALLSDLPRLRSARSALRQSVVEGPLGQHADHAKIFGEVLVAALQARSRPAG